MTPQSANQAAANALGLVLELFHTKWPHSGANIGNTDGTPLAYSYGLSDLWNFTLPKEGCTIAILWDAVAQPCHVGNVFLEAHLNPVTCAVCALMTKSDLNVIVFDPTPIRHRKQSRLYRLVEALQSKQMPWLRLISPDNFGRFLGDCSVPKDEVVSELLNVPHRDEMLHLLSHQMRAELTREGGENDRHAIQNIVGPMVLLGREYLAKMGVAQRALLRVFEATGLMSKDLLQGGKPINKIKEDSWGDQPLRLLLVDDQADYGWADWVRSNLPSSKPNLVTLDDNDVITIPEALLDDLDAELKLSEKADDRRFELQLLRRSATQKADVRLPYERQTIVLLDLRLHSMRSTDDEVAFFKRLLPLCEGFKTGCKASHCAWPGFSAHEIEVVKLWCENPKRENEAHFVALSLLPRLLSLLDMSLPIVLFSSTGRRNLLQYFEDYSLSLIHI